MDKGRFLIEAHLRNGRPIAELAAAHGVHRGWLYKLLARYRLEGRGRARAPLAAAHDPPDADRRPLRGRDRPHPQGARRRRPRRRGRDDPLPHGDAQDARCRRSRRSAGCSRPGASSPPNRRSAQELVERSPPSSPTSAGRRTSPTSNWPTAGLRGPQRDRRPLPAVCGVAGLRHHPLARRGAHLAQSGRDLGLSAAFLTDNGLIFTTPRIRWSGPWRPSCSPWASRSSTPGPTIPRPAARSSASTRRMKKYLAKQDPATTKKPPRTARPLRRLLQRGPTPPGLGRRTPLEAFDAREKAALSAAHRRGGLRVRHDKVDTADRSHFATRASSTTSGWAAPTPAGGSTMLVAGLDIDHRPRRLTAAAPDVRPDCGLPAKLSLRILSGESS